MSDWWLLATLIVVAVAIAIWIDEGYFPLLICVALAVAGWAMIVHKTDPERIAQEQQDAIPVTITEKLSDGCTLHKHYGKGKGWPHGPTEKYVSCPAADVTLIQSEKCGKHCRRDASITVKGTP